MNLATALKSRAAAFVVGAIVFLSIFFTLAGPSWGLALYRLLQDGGLALFWLLAAGGIGWLAAKSVLPTQPIDSLLIVTSIALGLGIISLLVLCLGLLGWMNQIFAVAIICLGDLIALITLYTRNKSWDAGAWLQESVSAGALWIASAAVGGIIALAACFPPGLLWGDEPNGYDVVEYHLQVPREWFEAAKIFPLHHNVFSYFPFNVEMHYLLAMFLHGGPWAGMYLAQFMHVGFCALVAWAAFAAAGGKPRGIVAGALLFATPWTGLLAPIAYNEGGTLLFITLAIAWALRASPGEPSPSPAFSRDWPRGQSFPSPRWSSSASPLPPFSPRRRRAFFCPSRPISSPRSCCFPPGLSKTGNGRAIRFSPKP